MAQYLNTAKLHQRTQIEHFLYILLLGLVNPKQQYSILIIVFKMIENILINSKHVMSITLFLIELVPEQFKSILAHGALLRLITRHLELLTDDWHLLCLGLIHGQWVQGVDGAQTVEVALGNLLGTHDVLTQWELDELLGGLLDGNVLWLGFYWGCWGYFSLLLYLLEAFFYCLWEGGLYL